KFVKLRVDMHEDTKFKIIDKMEQRDLIHYIWIRLIALAGKVNLGGELFLSRNIPYTLETLSIEFNREVSQVELAIKTFIKLEMVELTEDNIYRVKNFAKHQNIKIEEKVKREDKIDLNSKISEDKPSNNTAQNEKQLKDNSEAAVDLNDKVIPLNNSNAEESTEAKDNLNMINNIGSSSGNSFINHDASKDAITDKVLNMNDGNKINCIDKTVNNSKTCMKDIHVGKQEFNVSKTREKNINKGKRKNNIATNEINSVEDDNEEVIELQSGEITCGKGEQIISSFSF
ncbi:phage replisome organizer N-terminal domain-containing protein, partial [Clostridium sp. BL-8]|uniref:phage replisome organizer N-terminal domain-containing protein n=1 Tax=Clostridium sp. BL-8 TaxID=349938 RepID=UPI00098C85C4